MTKTNYIEGTVLPSKSLIIQDFKPSDKSI